MKTQRLLQPLRTAVVHAIESEDVHLTEVKVLSNDVVELWDFGGDGGDRFVLIEGERPIVHDRLVVVGCVLICDVVIVVFVEVMFKSSRKETPWVIICEENNLTNLVAYKCFFL